MSSKPDKLILISPCAALSDVNAMFVGFFLNDSNCSSRYPLHFIKFSFQFFVILHWHRRTVALLLSWMEACFSDRSGVWEDGLIQGLPCVATIFSKIVTDNIPGLPQRHFLHAFLVEWDFTYHTRRVALYPTVLSIS